jgi:hypothetical protein
MCMSTPDIPDPPPLPNAAPPPAAKTAVNIGRQAKAAKRSKKGARQGTNALRVPLNTPSGGTLNIPR